MPKKSSLRQAIISRDSVEIEKILTTESSLPHQDRQLFQKDDAGYIFKHADTIPYSVLKPVILAIFFSFTKDHEELFAELTDYIYKTVSDHQATEDEKQDLENIFCEKDAHGRTILQAALADDPQRAKIIIDSAFENIFDKTNATECEAIFLSAFGGFDKESFVKLLRRGLSIHKTQELKYLNECLVDAGRPFEAISIAASVFTQAMQELDMKYSVTIDDINVPLTMIKKLACDLSEIKKSDIVRLAKIIIDLPNTNINKKLELLTPLVSNKLLDIDGEFKKYCDDKFTHQDLAEINTFYQQYHHPAKSSAHRVANIDFENYTPQTKVLRREDGEDFCSTPMKCEQSLS